MHACVIAYTFLEADFRVRRYVEFLVEKGYEVDVIALRKRGEEPVHRGNGITTFRIMERRSDEKGILNYAFNLLMFFFKGTFVLLSRHRKVRHKIIHVHNVPDFLVFMGAVPKWRGAKLILDIHDILPECFCQKFGKDLRSFPGKVLFLLERLSARFADHVIVANDLWREKILLRCGLPPEKCTPLLNYPDMKFFRSVQPHRNGNGFRMIYPGTISHHHGVDIAIHALSLLAREIPNIRFDIYANRSSNLEQVRRIEALVEEKNLGDRVTIHDPLPLMVLGGIFANADVGVIPKRGGMFAGEAFSTKMLEFMAAGLPVVASRTKIDEYYFDDSMVSYFEPGNPSDMADRIREIYENPAGARKKAEKSSEFVSRNNWGTRKSIYGDILQRISAS